MEYTQWEYDSVKLLDGHKVLILVVMEYTQWESSLGTKKASICLNPCCNGIYSMRHKRVL